MTSSPTAMSKGLPADAALAAVIDYIAGAEACWFGSVRQGGRPHLAPIWFVWHEGRIFVVTQGASVRARNIAANPSVSIAMPDAVNAVIVEGEAALTPEVQVALQPLFLAKYNWDITTDAEYDTIIAVTPHKIMAWGSHGEGRWRLD